MQARCQVHVPIHMSYVAVLHDDNWCGQILVFSPENKPTQACVIGRLPLSRCNSHVSNPCHTEQPCKTQRPCSTPPYSRAAIRDPANSHGAIDSQDNGMHVQQPISRPWPLHSRLLLLLLSACEFSWRYAVKRELYVVVFIFIILVQLGPSSQSTRRTGFSSNGYGSSQGGWPNFRRRLLTPVPQLIKVPTFQWLERARLF